MERDTDPLSNNIIQVLEYLTSLHRSGKSYSTINLHRSMLSMTLETIDNTPLGQNPLIVKLLKGCYNENPPRPKYTMMWDPEVVLEFMRKSTATEELNLSTLSRKLATLLALSTLMRTAELAAIDRNSVVISTSGASFSLGKPRKTQSSGQLKTFNLTTFPDKRVCPVHCLGYYILVTDFLRSESNRHSLFIGLVTPHKSVTGNTIGRWIKGYLSSAGVDTSVFSAHSTRGAAASKAAESGESVNSILRAGGWSRQSTFARFYRRPFVPLDVTTSTISR